MTTRIMVADDSLFARMLAKEAVSHVLTDAEFLEATSGEDALSQAKASDYQLDWYLLDMNMGGPDGVDTAKALLSAGVAAEKIALVTGNCSKDLLTTTTSLGLTYINKSISPDDVDRFIERLRHFFTMP